MRKRCRDCHSVKTRTRHRTDRVTIFVSSGALESPWNNPFFFSTNHAEVVAYVFGDSNWTSHKRQNLIQRTTEARTSENI
ncbi:unnamed protein product [Calypogeia fissa]